MRDLRILYAENNQLVRDEYISVFQNYFSSIYAADNGFETLTLHRERNPDILIINLDLPDMCGIDVINKIRTTSRLPILILSDHCESHSLIRAINLNINGYVPLNFLKKSPAENINRILKIIDHFELLKKHKYFVWCKHEKFLTYDGQTIKLTTSENKLIGVIYDHRGEAVMYGTLSSVLWDKSTKESSYAKLVKTISRLNSKVIHTTSYRKNLIINFRQFGYGTSIKISQYPPDN